MSHNKPAPVPRNLDLRATPWFELLGDDGTLVPAALAFDDGGWSRHLQPGPAINHQQPLGVQLQR